MAKPFALGSTVTNRDGTPSKIGRSMSAPYWVCSQGVVVADYGNDEAAAHAHFTRLVRESGVGAAVRVGKQIGNVLGGTHG